MNINFKTHFPWPGADGQPEPTHFCEQILNEVSRPADIPRAERSYKLHTIRRVKDQPRFREGMRLVLQTGSRFKPMPFAETECTGTQMLHMELEQKREECRLNVRLILPATIPHLFTGHLLERLARHDGLSLENFVRWFTLDVLVNGPGYY
jgi:hypothetical protein